MNLIVQFEDGAWTARWSERVFPCVVGKNGVVEAEAKREGDGMTPAGTWPMRKVFYRADRLSAPETPLPVGPLKETDGWCDAPDDPHYNKQIAHPYPSSAERLWREDDIYDVIVVLGYNDAPVRPGRGSALFLHVRRADGGPTDGCVALRRDDLLAVLKEAGPGTGVEVLK